MTSIEERSILCFVCITEDYVAIKIMLKNNYFHEKKAINNIIDCSTDATRDNQNQSSKELKTGR